MAQEKIERNRLVFGGGANFFDNYDFEVIQNPNGYYDLSMETMLYIESVKDDIEYLKNLQQEFKDFMIDNNLSTGKIVRFTNFDFKNFFLSETLEELYFKFSLLVNGYEKNVDKIRRGA